MTRESNWSWNDVDFGVHVKVDRVTTKQFAQMIADHKVGIFVGMSELQMHLVIRLAREFGVTPENLIKDFIFEYYGIRNT